MYYITINNKQIPCDETVFRRVQRMYVALFGIAYIVMSKTSGRDSYVLLDTREVRVCQ